MRKYLLDALEAHKLFAQMFSVWQKTVSNQNSAETCFVVKLKDAPGLVDSILTLSMSMQRIEIALERQNFILSGIEKEMRRNRKCS